MKNKVMNVSDALDLVKDGDTIAISAVGPIGYPEFVAAKLEERYVETGAPKNLTLISAGGHGVPKQHICDERFAHEGLLKRHICTHPKVVPELRELIKQNKLEAYSVPQGVLNQLYRCTAAKQPGLLTKVGIGTYVDPRLEGGKLNEVTTEDIVRVMEIDGEEYLFFKSHPVTIALVRGTYADERGNVCIDHEALKLEMFECALAAKANGGKVIVQVERVVENFSIKAKSVVLPCGIVDAVVVTEQPEIYHKQTLLAEYNPYLSGEARGTLASTPKPKEHLETTDVILRRGVFELYPDAVVNLGAGMGGGMGEVASIEGIELNFTLELGVFGGIPLAPPLFGTSFNPESFVSPPNMFDYYHGGNLDITVLGAAEVDKDGNVNVSKFGGYANGQGGFIDISSCAKKIVYVLAFTAKGFEAEIKDGRLHIQSEGRIQKFVEEIEQITFNARVAIEAGHEVCYITERAVFRMTEEGLALTEIAPGLDLEKDVLARMGFRPIISKDLKTMDERIFIPGRIGCFD